MSQPARSAKNRLLLILLAVAHLAALALLLVLDDGASTFVGDNTVTSQPTWMPLLTAQTVCAATLLGLGSQRFIIRLIWFTVIIAAVLAVFFTAYHYGIDASLIGDVEAEHLPATTAISVGLALLIAIPALCVGVVLLLLRAATGPIAADEQEQRETPQLLAFAIAVSGVLLAGAIGWVKWMTHQEAPAEVASSAYVVKFDYTTYLASQLLGIVAFAFARGGFWRIVGFTYVVCVAMQGFMNQEPHDLAAFWSTAGPWVVVLATFLPLRWAGCLFAPWRQRLASERLAEVNSSSGA